MTTDNNIAAYPILIPNNAMFKHFQKKVSLLMCLQMSRAIVQVAGVGIASTELYICYDFSLSLSPTCLLQTTFPHSVHIPVLVSHVTFPFTITLLFRHHLPTWFSFILISDSDSLCLPSYLPISDTLYQYQAIASEAPHD